MCLSPQQVQKIPDSKSSCLLLENTPLLTISAFIEVAGWHKEAESTVRFAGAEKTVKINSSFVKDATCYETTAVCGDKLSKDRNVMEKLSV